MTRVHMGDDSGDALLGRQGWVCWISPSGLDVRVHFVRRDGSLEAQAAYISSTDRPLKTRDLHISMGRLVDALNDPALADEIDTAFASPDSPDLAPGSVAHAEVRDMVKATPPVARTPAPRAPLPGARDDVWYLLLLSTYSQRAATTRRAAVELAEEYGVPTTTLHRWLKEARRRRARYERDRDQQAASDQRLLSEARAAAAAEDLSLADWMERFPGWVSMLEENQDADPEVWLLDNVEAWPTAPR